MILTLLKLLLLTTIPKQINSSITPQKSNLQQSHYQSVASLNKYGQSQQIQNAMLASSAYGTTPILTSLAEKDNAIVVCYIKRKKLGLKSKDSMVHVISCTDDKKDSNEYKSMTVMIYSGIKADGKLLLSLLREYTRNYWERYDVLPTVSDITNEARDALLSFMGYNNNDDLILKFNEEQEEDLQMSRPFGIQALFVSISNKNEFFPIVQSMDPSGVTQSWVARALGYRNEYVNKKLQVLWRRHMDVEDVKKMCFDVLKDLYSYENLVRGDDMEIVYEILDGNDCTYRIDRRPFVLTQ